ncbi:MAG: Gfo/Idh/MocA family protein [Desulfovibrio sp.]
MADNRLKVGIAGYGVVGKRRRVYIDKHPGLKTVAVCDQAFGSDGIMEDGVLHFQHYRQLLDENLDILLVSLPNYIAPEVTIAGLEKGLHIFCEKPPGCTVEDIERVIETERKHPDLLLKYGFNHRYHDSVRKALEIVGSGELGKVVNLRGVYGKSKIIPFSGGWRSERALAGGGILLDQGIHMVDLMRMFCGEFVEVKSFVSNDYWHHDVEDNAYALMRDGSGRVAMLHSSATQWQHRFALDIALTDGFVNLSGLLTGSKSYGREQLIVGRRDEADTGSHTEQTITYLEDNSWRDEILEFADAVLNEGRILHGTSADALATMRLVYEIYKADPDWRAQWNL